MSEETKIGAFEVELTELLNRHNLEIGSNTPDFILARYLVGCLRQAEVAIHSREMWYGRKPRIAAMEPSSQVYVEVYRILDGTKAGDEPGNRGERITFEALRKGDLFTTYFPDNGENDGKVVFRAKEDAIAACRMPSGAPNWGVRVDQVFPSPA